MQKNVQFIVDPQGQETGVILPIEDYEEMLEDLHLGRAARESQDEARRPFEVFIFKIAHRKDFYE